jgi:hypothetical protein
VSRPQLSPSRLRAWPIDAIGWALSLCLAPAHAATYVQSAAQQGKDLPRSLTVTFPSTQTAGDLNVVFVAWGDTRSHAVAVTDTHHNIYLRAGVAVLADKLTQVAYYAKDIAHAVRGTNAVTVLFDAPVAEAEVRVAEYHGLDARYPLDGLANSDASTPASSAPLTTINADDLLIASAFGTAVSGPGPSYTQRLIDASRGLLEDATVSVRGTFRASVLQQSAGDAVIQLLAFRAPRGAPLEAPYPHSANVAHLSWDLSTVLSHRRGIGSDIWATTWAGDGNLYTAFGDGGGFDGTERSKATGRVSLGFARINGAPSAHSAASLEAKNVWGQAPHFAENPASFGGKVIDLIAVGGVLYAQGGLWTAANCACADPTLKNDDNPNERSLTWSRDLGRTWQISSWATSSALGSTLQFGPDYAGAFDPAHVYFYYQKDVTTDAREIYLRRALIRDLTADPATSGHFEYFAGTDARGGVLWSMSAERAMAVFIDARTGRGVYAGPSVVFDAPLGRYLAAVWHGNRLGEIGFFEAPAPWGPWATLAYYEDWGGFNETAGEATGFSFPAKWISADGKTLWAVFSGENNGGDNEFDSFNLVRVTLQ